MHSKGLLLPIDAGTMNNQNSLAKSLMKAYNWLKKLHLTPFQLETMTLRRLKKHLNLINDLDNVDNKDLFCLY